jgi:hypothetical protein
MAASGMALVRTDISEELSASISRVTRIGELGTYKVYFFAACVGCKLRLHSYKSHMMQFFAKGLCITCQMDDAMVGFCEHSNELSGPINYD